MTTVTTEYARVARRAAEIIGTNGRVIGDFLSYNVLNAGVPAAQCPVCPAGAIRIAAAEDHVTDDDYVIETGGQVAASLVDDHPFPLALHTEKALADWLNLPTPTWPASVVDPAPEPGGGHRRLGRQPQPHPRRDHYRAADLRRRPRREPQVRIRLHGTQPECDRAAAKCRGPWCGSTSRPKVNPVSLLSRLLTRLAASPGRWLANRSDVELDARLAAARTDVIAALDRVLDHEAAKKAIPAAFREQDPAADTGVFGVAATDEWTADELRFLAGGGELP